MESEDHRFEPLLGFGLALSLYFLLGGIGCTGRALKRFQEDVRGMQQGPKNAHLHVCLSKLSRLPTIPRVGDAKSCPPKSASKPSQGWK